ncbi:malonyl-ACP O-methyltransferase BioC [Porticoccaceae bacterium LTM1]|nr:malonyl-ACP O-methyltransferase BioC [Porticoccaceae bacterium LTM1]
MTEAVLQITPPALHLRHLPSPVDAEPLVILHGWGAASDIMLPLAERLANDRPVWLVDLPGFGGSEQWPEFSLDGLLEQLSEQLPSSCVLMGWSLGGMIATAFVARYSGRVSKLITLASNAQFVADRDWRSAMPAKTFSRFCQFFAESPGACLKQFIGLEAQGDQAQRELMKQLRPFVAVESNCNWNEGLELLGTLDNRSALQSLAIPGLHLFGGGDALVPALAGEAIADLNPGQTVVVIPERGHALHMSAPDEVCAAINEFLTASAAKRLDKQSVAESFSRAASSYDGAAAFQRLVADRLWCMVPAEMKVGCALDVGCGTGYLSAKVRDGLPSVHLTSLDLAPGMLEYARAQRPVADRWVCGDAESLPLADNQFDLVVSSLAYQWCENPDVWGSELYRVLNEQGVAIFSTFGANTLTELHDAWRAVDDYVHVNEFIAVEKLRDQLQIAGLQVELVVEKHQLEYDDLKSLMRELKALGAHNINSGRNQGMTGRKRLQLLTDAYEKFRTETGVLPASYEVIYGVVKKEA